MKGSFIKLTQERMYQFTQVNTLKSRLILSALLCMPILFYFGQYLTSSNAIYVGDFDYYTQMYTAFRITVLEYGQFPSWNPWMSGGIPLYANPQFGLFSLQSLLVLIFGGALGLKFAYVIYALAGFWGMYLLSKNVIGSSSTRSGLLGYIWIFNGFFAGHNINHFTFSLFFLFPWLIYFMYRWKEKLSWLYLGLLVSLIALSSMHYALLMTGLSVGLFMIAFTVRGAYKNSISKEDLRRAIVFGGKTVLVISILSAHRVITAYSFIKDNPRPSEILSERSPDLFVLLQSIFLPVETILPIPSGLQWGWGEYSAYIGIGATLALFLTLGLVLKKGKSKIINNRSGFFYPLIILGILGLILAIGDFGVFSPYALMHHIPGFSEFRVSSRWLYLSMFCCLVILALVKYKERLINILLLISVIELFMIHGYFAVIQNSELVDLPKNIEFNRTFTQFDNGFNHLNFAENIDFSQTYKTLRNEGQIYADDSVVNTLNRVIGTERCGYNIDRNCDLVLSDNADVAYWSPNKIVLTKTGPGALELNINPNKYWVLNERIYPFPAMNRVDPDKRFIIDTDSKEITLQFAPRLSPAWFMLRL